MSLYTTIVNNGMKILIKKITIIKIIKNHKLIKIANNIRNDRIVG